MRILIFLGALSTAAARKETENHEIHVKNQDSISALQRLIDHSEQAKNEVSSENFPRPSEVADFSDLFTLGAAVTCPEGPEYDCCRSLQRIGQRPVANNLTKYLDNSGTFRQPGLAGGDQVSDGRYKSCKRENLNYCKLKVAWDFFAQKFYHCLPETCGVESLNLYLELIEGNEDAKWPFAKGKQFRTYTACFDPALKNAKFEWYYILFWVWFAVWGLFLLVSPIKSLHINTIMASITEHKSQKRDAVLRSLNGIRVLSLFWVIMGHMLLDLLFDMPNNGFDVYDYFIWENPINIIIANGTTSVDSFFVMGGLLTGYLMKKTYDKVGKFDFKMFALAVLNRSLRLMPVIAAAIVLGMMFFLHKGTQTATEKAFLDTVIPDVMDPYRQAELCKGSASLWSIFNIIWLNNKFLEDPILCYGHLWYVSVEYWCFIFGVLCLMVTFKNYKLGKWLIISVILGSMIATTVVEVLTNGEFSYVVMVKRHGLQNPYPDRLWLETYTIPFYRAHVYFTGLLTGYWLVDVRGNATKVGRYTWWNKVEVVLLTAFLTAIIVFPLPNYIPSSEMNGSLPYPSSVGIAYSCLYRPLWGFGLSRLIWNLEKYRTGWAYNFLSCKFWEIFAKLNFSAYVIHYILLPWFTQLFMFEQYQFNGMFAFIIGTGEIILVYMVSLVFYVMVEYPLSLGSQKIMTKLRGSK